MKKTAPPQPASPSDARPIPAPAPSLDWPPEDAKRARQSLIEAAPLLMSAPRAAWALMIDASISATRDPSNERLRGIDQLRRDFFLVERASELAAADAASGAHCSDRHYVLRNLADKDQTRYLEPYLKAFPAERRYDMFSELGETILTWCERPSPPLESLKLWCDLEMIARTAKRANQALANGQAEASSTIKKPSLATMRDFLRDHPSRFSPLVAEFFEPIVRLAAASSPAKLAPGAPTRRLLSEIFSPRNAASMQKMMDRVAGRAPEGLNRLSSEALDRFYGMIPERCFEDWASDLPLVSALFLERSDRPAELSRFIQAFAQTQEGGLERRFSFGELHALKDPLRNMDREKGSSGQFAAMARLGAPLPGPHGAQGITLLEACVLAGAAGAAKELRAQGARLPGKERFEALLADAVRCRAIGKPSGDGEDAREASLKALPLYEALELSDCLGEAPKARRSAI